jgi:hypothetical protein
LITFISPSFHHGRLVKERENRRKLSTDGTKQALENHVLSQISLIRAHNGSKSGSRLFELHHFVHNELQWRVAISLSLAARFDAILLAAKSANLLWKFFTVQFYD